ncbi:MAG: chain length determinant protein [Methylobacter sp.]|nr:MAG: chain length determinant protein [Methylobacter sp.]
MAESQLTPVASESVPTGAIMPLVSLKKHWKISAGVIVVMALLGIPVAWKKGTSYYAVTAVVHVAPRVATILQDSKEQEIPSYQQYLQFLTQQASTVARYDIVLEALKRLGNKRYVWQLPDEEDRRAAERLQAALVVKPVKDTYLFSVTLESDKKDYLDDIVNTVIAVYFEEARKDLMLYASKERLAFLYGQRKKFQDIVTEKKKHLSDIAQEISVTTFVDNAPNPYDDLLADSQKAYSVAQRERMAAEAGLQLFENPKDAKASAALESLVSEQVYKDQGLYSLKANMYLRRSKLVEQISGLDVKHPWHEQIKKQLAVIEAEVVEATTQLSNDVKRMLLEERRSKVTLTRQIEQGLLAQITEQKKRASWFSNHYNEALTLTQDIKRFYQQLETVENRINFIELESNAPGYIRMESYARPPEQAIRGGKKKIFIIFVVLGGILGLIVPIIMDLLDRRIKTAGQVEKLLGYKPLAALLENGQDGVPPHIIADQKRRLALALNRERLRSAKASNLILLTAVTHDSNTTSLAFDLARDFGNMDVSAVVVEVNTLKADARYLTDPIKAGVFDLIVDADITVQQIVSPADSGYPDRIALSMPDDSLLFGYLRLQAALGKLSEQYAMVILDAAPVLLSADVEFFASISDITLLLIAAQKTQPGEIKRAVQVLERVDPKVISFIVTRLKVFKGGGYYSKVYAQTPAT